MTKIDNFDLSVNQRGAKFDFSWLADLKIILKNKFKLQQAISVALVSENEIKELNRVYRHQNKVTDVLSFTINSPEILGEVVICPIQARRQAKISKLSLKSELQLLTIHGILHLLGYDHTKSHQQAKQQVEQEQKILALLN